MPVGENTFPDLKKPEHLARHPYGRIPAMRHGDVELFESTAICAYVNGAFDGPSLVPGEYMELELADAAAFQPPFDFADIDFSPTGDRALFEQSQGAIAAGNMFAWLSGVQEQYIKRGGPSWPLGPVGMPPALENPTDQP